MDSVNVCYEKESAQQIVKTAYIIEEKVSAVELIIIYFKSLKFHSIWNFDEQFPIMYQHPLYRPKKPEWLSDMLKNVDSGDNIILLLNAFKVKWVDTFYM